MGSKDSKISNHEFESINSNTSYDSFREMPIDCPSIINESLNETKINEKIPQEEVQLINLSPVKNNQLIYQNIDNNINNSIVPSNRKLFLRNSSLSTIAEERTVINPSPQSPNHEQISSARLLIQSLVHEFSDKTILVDEILKVFEPSSKDGTFNRNVNVRFSSPVKKMKSNSPLLTNTANNSLNLNRGI